MVAPRITIEMIREMIATAINEALPGVVAAEVTRVMGDTIPEMFTQITTQVGEMMQERFATLEGAGGGQPRGFTYKDFSVCSPPEFLGESDPKTAIRWISDVEGVFLTSGCPENLKARFAINLLRGAARDWWLTQEKLLTREQIMALTWDDFVTRLRNEYVPQVEVERITREFLDLRQTTETISEINAKFRELSSFCPEFTATEAMKMTRYLSMLRDDIREFVSVVPRTTLAEMMATARGREIELEGQRKNKRSQQAVTVAASATKKQRTFEFRPFQGGNGQKNPTQSNENRGPLICYKCGKTGHMARDCKVPMLLCFNCNQTGHMRKDCPKLKTGEGTSGVVQAPAPATLRITDGRTGQAPGRAFLMAGEETRRAPDNASGINYCFIILYVGYLFDILNACQGFIAFLVNLVPAFMLIACETVRSLVSANFGKLLG